MKHFDLEPDFVFSPQPMYMIGTNNPDGSPNFCIITWLGFSADDGPCIMISIGGSKLTVKNILRDGRFSANMVTEDNLWLADYFGTTKGEAGQKNDLPYTVTRGKRTDVPILEESHWIYECEVVRHLELNGANLFVAKVTNIQVDEKLKDMDMEHIDLSIVRPAVYSPYQYYSIGEKLGEMGQWKEHYQGVDHVSVSAEKAINIPVDRLQSEKQDLCR